MSGQEFPRKSSGVDHASWGSLPPEDRGERLAPGIYVWEGQVHEDAVEILTALGAPVTPESGRVLGEIFAALASVTGKSFVDHTEKRRDG